jgi:transcriptional regulator with XRE-family HTH domain
VAKSWEATVQRLSRTIRERRLLVNLSQADLARLAGVSYRRVQQIEAAEVANPSLRVLYRLATALQTDIADLLRPTQDRDTQKRAPKRKS